MNKIYKVIWNKSLLCWQVVSELGKNNTARSQSVAKVETHLDQHKTASTNLLQLTGLGFVLSLLPLSIYAQINANSLPTGATVTQGSAQFNQNNNTLNINQNTQNLSTNWNSFNIGQDATVNFNQPNSSSIAINRVLDSNASQIMGRLNANGQIFLLNPNGVVFSKTAQVNVGAIVASTLNFADGDLTQGKFTLKNSGSAGSVENYGSIIANGGVAALIAPVVNNQGSIQNNGTGTNVVHLTAADQVSLQLQDGRLTEYKIDLGTLQGLVDNGGAIQANNGAVYLTAKAKDSLSKAVVNHTGIIEANRLSQNAKGEIILLGDMQNGTTTVSGTLKAEGKNGADGGFIETSAAQVQIQDTAKVSTLSDGGKVGNYLIDPFEMTITDGGPDTTANSISASYLQNLLQTSTVTLNTDGANESQSGDINVNADVTWGSANSLILTAYNNINIGANMDGGSILLNGKNIIQTAGAVRGGLIFNTSGNVILSSVGNSINSIGGNVGGNLNLVTQIALANYQALTVAGNLSLVSSRDVTLTNVGNSFSSPVNINARNTELTASSALTLGVLDVDSLTVYAPTIKLPTLLNTVGLQVLKGNIELMGDTHLTSTLGLIQLSGTLNGKYALTINTTSDVIFDGNVGNSIALQSLNVNGLGMTNGDITTIGDITFNKVLNLQGNTTLRSISGDINTATISTQSSTNNLNLSASSGAIHINGDISANQISIFAKSFSGLGINGLGDLNINTHESLIQSAGYTVDGSAQITSDNNITLASTNNQFGKKVTLTGHDITLNNTTNLELDTVNATGDLVATAINGDIFQSALLKIDGNTSFSAGGNITLINSMNDFVGTISAYGKNILISDVNLLNLKSISADYLTVRAGSDLSLNGVINVDKDINLSSNGKFINNEGASALNSSQGRWLIYLNNIESGHFYNNLDSNNKAILGVNGSSNIGESGNRYIFSENLDINLTTLDKIKNYGETIDLIDAYKVEGLLSGVEGAYKGHSLDDALNNSLKVGLDIHSAGTNVLADVNANPYKIEIFPTNFNNKQGYNLNLINAGILKVIPKDITVTANGGTSIYGDNPLNPNLSASGLANGETTAVLTGLNNSFGINNVTNAGSYSLTVDGTLTNGNYNITQRNDGTWVVGKKDITVTANSNHTAVYNGKDQTVTGFTATGLVNGETESVLTNVTASGIGKNAGSYSSKATGNDDNYNLTFVDGSLDIAKANATVTANSNHTAVYNGKDQSVTGFTATGLVNGETESVLTNVTASGTGKNAGSYNSKATGSDDNYNLTFVDGSLDIAKANATVTANSGSTTYNGKDQTVLGFTATGLVNGETESVLTNVTASGIGKNAGSYSSKATGSDDNYNLTFVDGSLDIAKANATVTANSGSTTYNGKDQTVSGFTATGLVNGETESVLTGVTASGTGKNAGSYSSKATGSDANYNLTFVDGSLDIAKANATVIANSNHSAVYNGRDQSVTGFTATGLVNGETESVLSGVTASGTGKNAGSYSSKATGSDANYNLTFVDGSLDIAKANATVTANSNHTAVYNGKDQSVTGFTATGLVNGETESVLTNVTASATGKNAGSYNSKATGSDSNYNLTFVDGSLDIAKANATVTANSNHTAVYNGKDQTVTGFTATGLVNGETESVLTGVTASGTGKNAGSYSSKATGSDSNYNLTFIDGSLDIAKAQLHLNAVNDTRIYDGTNTSTGLVSITGLQGNDSASATQVFDSRNAGNRTLNVTGVVINDGNNGNNYIVQTQNATGTINKALITQVDGITANSRFFDGTTNATLNFNNSQLLGKITGDDLYVASAQGQFTDLGIGQDKTVNINNIQLAGADAANYQLIKNTAQTTANMTLMTPTGYLQAIQFQPVTDHQIQPQNSARIDVQNGGVNINGLQVMQGGY